MAHNPQALGRRRPHVEILTGDLFDDRALEQLITGVDAIVHLADIIDPQPDQGITFDRMHVTATRRVVEMAQQLNVKRLIHLSVLGARPDAASDYQRSKWLAEQIVRQSGLDWTIFQPSLIHGEDSPWMQRIRQFCCDRTTPLLPYIARGGLGRGRVGKVQPIYVVDVAHYLAAALVRETSIGETYPMGGPDQFTWPQLLKICHGYFADARPGRKPVPVPAWFARMMAGSPRLPFNRDQVIMSLENSVCSTDKLQQTFEITPVSFEKTFAGYANKMHWRQRQLSQPVVIKAAITNVSKQAIS